VYLHYYNDDLKNWSINDKIWEGILSNQTCMRLMDIVKCIVKELSEIEL